jgi:hypothetical protein
METAVSSDRGAVKMRDAEVAEAMAPGNGISDGLDWESHSGG